MFKVKDFTTAPTLTSNHLLNAGMHDLIDTFSLDTLLKHAPNDDSKEVLKRLSKIQNLSSMEKSVIFRGIVNENAFSDDVSGEYLDHLFKMGHQLPTELGNRGKIREYLLSLEKEVVDSEQLDSVIYEMRKPLGISPRRSYEELIHPIDTGYGRTEDIARHAENMVQTNHYPAWRLDKQITSYPSDHLVSGLAVGILTSKRLYENASFSDTLVGIEDDLNTILSIYSRTLEANTKIWGGSRIEDATHKIKMIVDQGDRIATIMQEGFKAADQFQIEYHSEIEIMRKFTKEYS